MNDEAQPHGPHGEGCTCLPHMFYVGAQEADGEWLASSFTVFYNAVPTEAAAQIVMDKIALDIDKLGLDTANGEMSFMGISTWQEFAEIPLDDEVKTLALVEAVVWSSVVLLRDIYPVLNEGLEEHWSKAK